MGGGGERFYSHRPQHAVAGIVCEDIFAPASSHAPPISTFLLPPRPRMHFALVAGCPDSREARLMRLAEYASQAGRNVITRQQPHFSRLSVLGSSIFNVFKRLKTFLALFKGV